ncbi:(2Fe-2S)-binding protein [Pseudonocardia sp. WMMC193]|uniref:(2Fe-2S)-binding protein n=1 Tax=Pseudonocardia sp. WMMC193 TaxID=2911965 RepID=UPI001F32D454|nr:(2Fe-2S)-binding protein [Pseudonocardia sp. WMMC193]MCF7551536.1 (2Fe-2S)-binding protein [Pseudonocardia sp. WMMC193]
MTDKQAVTVTINGHVYTDEVEPRLTLADFIRHRCGLTGTHLGCEHGVCGACTIMLDGRTARACLMLAVQVDGCTLTTVEGLAEGDRLSPLQEAFWNNHGLQCGFCTPGMLMCATELLQADPDPTAEKVRTCLSGNLCRCTGYDSIVTSVLSAAERLRS